jgi:DNA polymerase-3 subunit delta'
MQASRAETARGFGAVLGNERIKKILRLALEKDRVPNSLIFSGPKGVGKGRLAVILAQALNCERETADACGECPTCLRIARHKLPDVWEVEPDGQSIKLEQMLQVRQAAYLRPLAARRRVFIINEAEKLTEDAANSLLKILEEPPLFSHLILVTSNPHLILPTIKSRCRILSFGPIGKEEIAKVLVGQGQPEERAKVIALLVNGNLEAAKNLDWEAVQEARREAWNIFVSLQKKGDASVFLRSYGFARREVIRDDLERVLGILASFCRDASLLKTGGERSLLLNPDYAADLEGLETDWGPEKYAECLSLIEQLISGLRKSLNMSLLATSFYSLMGETRHA